MNWYPKNGSGGQGLVIDEDTGANIAVAYDAKHAPLLAAAPVMLTALIKAEADLRSSMRAFGMTTSAALTAVSAAIAAATVQQCNAALKEAGL